MSLILRRKIDEYHKEIDKKRGSDEVLRLYSEFIFLSDPDKEAISKWRESNREVISNLLDKIVDLKLNRYGLIGA